MSKSKPTPATVLAALMGEYQLNPFSLSKAIHISNSAMLQILKSKGKIKASTAMRLAKFFGQSAAYWLDLQRDVDLEEAGNNKELTAILKGIGKAVKPKAVPKAAPKAALKEKPKAKGKAKTPVKKPRKTAAADKSKKAVKAPVKSDAKKPARGRPARKA